MIFISLFYVFFRPETRKRVYSPPEDLEDAILEITLKVFPELNSDNWMSQELKDVSTKYQVIDLTYYCRIILQIICGIIAKCWLTSSMFILSKCTQNI